MVICHPDVFTAGQDICKRQPDPGSGEWGLLSDGYNWGRGAVTAGSLGVS